MVIGIDDWCPARDGEPVPARGWDRGAAAGPLGTPTSKSGHKGVHRLGGAGGKSGHRGVHRVWLRDGDHHRARRGADRHRRHDARRAPARRDRRGPVEGDGARPLRGAEIRAREWLVAGKVDAQRQKI